MARLEARKKRLGPLDALTIEGDPSAPTVVLMHGYGADMADLASLAGIVQAPKGTNWVFPNGHLKIPLGDHYEGRGWFPISISELERTGGIDISTLHPPGMKKSRENLLQLIEALKVPANQLILGGFSQGGMLATELTLHLPEPPRGLVVLSGTLVNIADWKPRAEKLRSISSGFEFFQSHGRYDTVLSFGMAQRLEAMFRESGWKGQLQPFEGGHEIPPEVLIQLGAYLRRRSS